MDKKSKSEDLDFWHPQQEFAPSDKASDAEATEQCYEPIPSEAQSSFFCTDEIIK